MGGRAAGAGAATPATAAALMAGNHVRPGNKLLSGAVGPITPRFALDHFGHGLPLRWVGDQVNRGHIRRKRPCCHACQ
eukprot:468967-Amphidinium_carterae.1